MSTHNICFCEEVPYLIYLLHCALRFLKNTGEICDKIFTYLNYEYSFKKKRWAKDIKWCVCDVLMWVFFSDFLYKGICSGYSFELHQQVDAIQMVTHYICLHKEVDKNYTGCNLKTTELFDCVLIGVHAVFGSKNVSKLWIWTLLLLSES